jgi:hypothetical protein
MTGARCCIPLLCLLLLCACGIVRSTVTTSPATPVTTRQYVFTPVQVESKEQTDDARAYNTQLKTDAHQALLALVRGRGAQWVKPGGTAPTIVVRIYSIYGNRVLRALVGWGAGSAKISVDITLLAADGHVLYSTHTEGKLRRGLAGGDAVEVGKRTIDEAFQDFEKRL